ncbi:MAG: alpha/beta fold hydrolase [Terrimesophilobacter sp.]
MRVSRRHAVAGGSRNLRFWRSALVVGGASVGAGAIAAAAVTVFAALMARQILVPPLIREQDTKIVAVDHQAKTITFSRSLDAVTDGMLSFWFHAAQGHARIGRIVSESEHTVTRELLRIDFGDLDSASKGRFNGWFYLYPSDLGLDYENVVIETELGPAPAWLVRAEQRTSPDVDDRWVIQVHGRAVMRTETIRAVPVFREAGYTCLLISYRNDWEAPSSSDGRYSLGDTEWKDVEAAIAFAKNHGATSIVLMGWSMGGATVLQAVSRSPLAGTVHGVVLDSPVIDWVDALDFQAKAKGVIKPLRTLVYAMIGSRWGRPFTGLRAPIDLARLDFVRRAIELEVPMLILHSDDDRYVPSAPSRALAKARSDIVTLESFQIARHTKLWNYDPERWNGAIRVWLAALPLRSAPTSVRTVRSQRRQAAE